jgi:hypothetical protein
MCRNGNMYFLQGVVSWGNDCARKYCNTFIILSLKHVSCVPGTSVEL